MFSDHVRSFLSSNKIYCKISFSNINVFFRHCATITFQISVWCLRWSLLVSRVPVFYRIDLILAVYMLLATSRCQNLSEALFSISLWITVNVAEHSHSGMSFFFFCLDSFYTGGRVVPGKCPCTLASELAFLFHNIGVRTHRLAKTHSVLLAELRFPPHCELFFPPLLLPERVIMFGSSWSFVCWHTAVFLCFLPSVRWDLSSLYTLTGIKQWLLSFLTKKFDVSCSFAFLTPSVNIVLDRG